MNSKLKLKMKMKMHKSFRANWISIKENSGKKELNINSNNFVKDDFFEEFLPPNLLVDDDMCTKECVDYTNYTPNEFQKIDLYNCFNGILSYIYLYSNNKLNTSELEFYFSGAQIFKHLLNSKHFNNQFNIMNIFNNDDINSYIEIGSFKEAFFGVKFKRIKINPVCYSIKIGLYHKFAYNITYNFECFNDETKKWDVLDERVNLKFDQIKYLTRLFPIRPIANYYSAFRIHQTEPIIDKTWGFRLIAIDIHGSVKYNENSDNFDFLCSDNFDNTEDFNPFIDITNFLI